MVKKDKTKKPTTDEELRRLFIYDLPQIPTITGINTDGTAPYERAYGMFLQTKPQDIKYREFAEQDGHNRTFAQLVSYLKKTRRATLEEQGKSYEEVANATETF